MHLWLKFYIQARLVEPGKRADWKANMSTFIVSAFWHGFYPFYYVMFFFAAVMNEASKDLYKARYIFRFIPAEIGPYLANFITMIVLNYNGVMFNALTFENGIKFGNATYWCVFALCTGVLVFSRSFGLVRYVQKLEAKAAEKAKKVEEASEKKEAMPEPEAAVTADVKKDQ